MSPDAQRIAIAEACPGWKPPFVMTTQCEWTDSRNGVRMLSDPLDDLNACHEMEKVLTALQRGLYRDILVDISGNSYACFATATQRAESFLKTLNLWTT